MGFLSKKRKDPFKEIQACLQKRDYKGALDWFNTLLSKDKKNTQIRLRFADTLVLAGNKREAVKQYRIVADELAGKGFMIRAIAINKKILQLDPNQTDVHAKLAEMNEERSATADRQAALAAAMGRPSDPLPGPAAPTPPVAPPAPEPPPAAPVAVSDMSLEESMAMEFGAADATPAATPTPPTPDVEEPIPAPPPPESEAEPALVLDIPEEPAVGGFELIDDASPVEEPSAPMVLDEEPAFSEEPLDLGGGPSDGSAGDDHTEVMTLDAAEGKTEPQQDLGLEVDSPASASPEIVLEMESATPEPTDASVEAVELPAASEGVIEIEAEPVVASLASSDLDVTEESAIQVGEEMEIIEFVDTEPEAAPGAGESLVGALGEDIDSLIDSIIDDVGSSASGTPMTDSAPPTHIPLFSDLTTDEFIDVALLLVRRVAKTGELVVKQGDPGDSMFIVSTGEVRATIDKDGQQVPIAKLTDGDFFGEMAVLSGEPRSATVTAVKNTELLELSRENLQEICSRHPHVEAKIRLAYDERVSNN